MSFFRIKFKNSPTQRKNRQLFFCRGDCGALPLIPDEASQRNGRNRSEKVLAVRQIWSTWIITCYKTWKPWCWYVIQRHSFTKITNHSLTPGTTLANSNILWLTLDTLQNCCIKLPGIQSMDLVHEGLPRLHVDLNSPMSPTNMLCLASKSGTSRIFLFGRRHKNHGNNQGRLSMHKKRSQP